MEKLGFSKRILEMNFMKNIEKERNNKTNNNINESQWEISIPQIEKIVDKTIDGFYNKKKKSIVDTILKNSRIKSQLKKKKIEKKRK
jgi:hypothetical protein